MGLDLLRQLTRHWRAESGP